uniref:Uncharacterized protein n=1 Tax=Arundo donax TaxID=35708 RepID=A0A0A9AYH8_ARUDO
MTHIVDLFVG